MTISTLVDTNILIDILGPDTAERQWSLKSLKQCVIDGDLVTNVVIWSELAASPLSEEQLTSALSWLDVKREAVPFEAAFRAGKAHRLYRRAGGQRERILPDFLVGAHADWRRHRLLTRDAVRYRSYFPSLDLITPETHP
ncbi:type II toxin-antitoxin system VapC family toxin [Rhizobium sp. 007]|uniref:type II toxin-antitoxin system VapC family toxin n=1 Tax=Rhizobium sp. 007 TaxID=2785056 RepID=UPI000B6ABC73|nr:type II toxin-antitoxin system VapC family toxin [Rhizobium sp. 007]OWK24932.1 DNA-binding protein [Rhizobium yanglingense]QPB19016.1 type II toxin-antitoxin system VapC family toxin [Rhizobium sp. 007]